MKLEVWMLVGVGIAFAVGFGLVTVLLLALHAEVRRLGKAAVAAQRALAANLTQAMPTPRPARPAAPEPLPLPALRLRHEPPAVFVEPHRAEPEAVATPEASPARESAEHSSLANSLAVLAEAAAAIEELAPAVERYEPEVPVAAEDGPVWNPDRRLLVMRLASRGKKPDQIAAALRIPQSEVEMFLESNELLQKR